MSDISTFRDFGTLMGYSIHEKILANKIIVGFVDTTKASNVKSLGTYTIDFIASFNLDESMIEGFNISTVTWDKDSEIMRVEYKSLLEELNS